MRRCYVAKAMISVLFTVENGDPEKIAKFAVEERLKYHYPRVRIAPAWGLPPNWTMEDLVCGDGVDDMTAADALKLIAVKGKP